MAGNKEFKWRTKVKLKAPKLLVMDLSVFMCSRFQFWYL